MNRARQDAITTEIMEIVGGAEARAKMTMAILKISSPNQLRVFAALATDRTDA